MSNKKEHQEKPFLRWMGIALAVLSVLVLALPYGSYEYRKVQYTVSGFDLVTGRMIMGGEVAIPASGFVILGVIAAAALFLFLIFGYKRVSPRVAGDVSLILSFVGMFVGIVLIVTMTTAILSEARKPAMGIGVYLYMAISLAQVVLSYVILARNKIVNALDYMVIPGLVYVVINNYIPMVGISFAFKNIDYSIGVWKSPWVGLDNFEFLFKSQDALVITRNTLLYNLAFIVLGNVLGAIVGICLNEIFSRKLQKLYQTTILLPQLISWVIVAYIAYGFLSSEAGWINKTVLGPGNEINFYGTTTYWPWILIFFNLWKGLGYNSIIYLSSIVGIDRNLYEAASIDGCSRLGAVRYITLPLLKPTFITLITLAVGRIFYSDFGLFYQVPMNSGALYSVTDTIDTYVYRALMKLNNISMASAASAFQAIIGFVTVLVFNAIVRRYSRENALF